MSEARTHFYELVRAAEGGEEVIITRRGRPYMKLVPLESGLVGQQPAALRKIGWAPGATAYGTDLDDDLTAMFEALNGDELEV